MRSAIAFSVAALAGSAFAAPSYGAAPQNEVVQNVHVVVETVVHTVYVTEGGYSVVAKPTHSHHPGHHRPAYTTLIYAPAPPKPTSVYVAPPAPTSVYVAPPAPTSQAPAPPVYTPAPAPEPVKPTTTAAPAPAPTAAGYMGIVDEWRAKLGLSKLECDSKLESNAMDTVTEGNGKMVHKLNPGTYGQVLAPGDADLKSFLHVFVGGWLCEMPNLPGLDGICNDMSHGWSYEGQTGHAEILTSPNYSKIGCEQYEGIWGCDLA